MSVFTSNDNDLGDRIGLLERVDRVRNDRPTRDYREQFVKAHAPAPSRRDDNSREHLLNVKKVKRVSTLKRRKGKPIAIQRFNLVTRHDSCRDTSWLSVLPSARPATFACNAFITPPICALDVAPVSAIVSRTTLASSSEFIACGR